jgi:hypothetical protein
MDSSPVLSHRGRLGHAVRVQDPDLIRTATRDLAAAKLEQYIERTLADAPDLTDAQLDRVGALLRLGGRRA